MGTLTKATRVAASRQPALPSSLLQVTGPGSDPVQGPWAAGLPPHTKFTLHLPLPLFNLLLFILLWHFLSSRKEKPSHGCSFEISPLRSASSLRLPPRQSTVSTKSKTNRQRSNPMRAPPSHPVLYPQVLLHRYLETRRAQGGGRLPCTRRLPPCPPRPASVAAGKSGSLPELLLQKDLLPGFLSGKAQVLPGSPALPCSPGPARCPRKPPVRAQ